MVKYTSNLIPAMTAVSTPSGQVIYSSYSTSYAYYPWRAFDGVSTITDRGWVSNNNLPSWIGYMFPSPVAISKYAIIGAINTTEMNGNPKTWTFQGSNDGTTWNTLDTRTNVPSWTAQERREYTFSNSILYKYYRLYITATIGSYSAGAASSAVFINEIEMMGLVPDRYLIKQSDKYYSINPNFYTDNKFNPLSLSGGAVPNKTDIDTYSFNSLSDLITMMTIKTISGVDKGVLGSGKYFEFSISNDVKSFKTEPTLSQKYLIQYNSQILTFNGSKLILSPSQTLDQSNFTTNGFSNITLVPESEWGILTKSNIKIDAYITDTTKTSMSLDCNITPFKPIDVLSNNFELKLYK